MSISPAEKLSRILGKEEEQEQAVPETVKEEKPREVIQMVPEAIEEEVSKEDLPEELDELADKRLEKIVVEAEVIPAVAEEELVVETEADKLVSEIYESQKESIEEILEIEKQYPNEIAEENAGEVIIGGVAMMAVNGEYIPYEEAQVIFQERKVIKEYRKFKLMQAKLAKSKK